MIFISLEVGPVGLEPTTRELKVLIKGKLWPSTARFHAGNSAENLIKFSAGILLV